MRERDGSDWWPADKPLNDGQPSHVPVRPQGDIPVIVRLAWPAGDELIPGRAIRWVEGYVMVMIKPIGAPSSTDELSVWLQSRDVYTSIPRRPYPRRKARGPGSGQGGEGPVTGSAESSAAVPTARTAAPYRPAGSGEPF